jgi:ADP-ribose pyrophosphatase YjhB (NUDIX family)
MELKHKDESSFLTAYNQSDYDRPSLAADMVAFTIISKETKDYRKLPEKAFSLLLIKRGEHPYMNFWALPGGFVRTGETVEATAYRELEEEAGVTDICLSQIHCFSEPKRDPRGWIVSCSFMALAEEEQYHLNPGDDAVDAKWFNITYDLIDTKTEEIANKQVIKKQYQLQLCHLELTLSALIEVSIDLSSKRQKVTYDIRKTEGIAFDHAKIIAYAISQLRENLNSSMLAFELLPDYFTLTDLQQVYEAVLGEELITANFRRKIADYVVETEKRVEGQGHRPSKLYQRNVEKRM